MRPLNKKLIPYFKAFKDVSKVIGEEEALKQLERVWDCPKCFGYREEKTNLSEDLIDLFVWMDSPQGHFYWSDINRQIIEE